MWCSEMDKFQVVLIISSHSYSLRSPEDIRGHNMNMCPHMCDLCVWRQWMKGHWHWVFFEVDCITRLWWHSSASSNLNRDYIIRSFFFMQSFWSERGYYVGCWKCVLSESFHTICHMWKANERLTSWQFCECDCTMHMNVLRYRYIMIAECVSEPPTEESFIFQEFQSARSFSQAEEHHEKDRNKWERKGGRGASWVDDRPATALYILYSRGAKIIHFSMRSHRSNFNAGVLIPWPHWNTPLPQRPGKTRRRWNESPLLLSPTSAHISLSRRWIFWQPWLLFSFLLVSCFPAISLSLPPPL